MTIQEGLVRVDRLLEFLLEELVLRREKINRCDQLMLGIQLAKFLAIPGAGLVILLTVTG